MNYFTRQNWFYGALVVSLLTIHHIFDIDLDSVVWGSKAGFLALAIVLYQGVVLIPTIFDELQKQREINGKLNVKLVELKDKIESRK